MADPLASLSAVVVPRGDADLDERERFLDSLTRLPLPRSFVFATCHRVELYAVDQTTLPRARGSRLLRGTEAARHLFRVAAGLESLVAGEVQILGQLRRVRGSVRGEPLLEALIERALRLGRDVRAGTALGSMTRSLGSLAVDEALRFVDRPAEATALVVGAGEMGKLASRALRHRVRTLLVANRDAARAAALASEIDAKAVPLADLNEALARATCVISAADTRGALFDAPRLHERLLRGPLVIVDLAVPRSVGADARALAGLVYRTADDLRDRAAPPASAIGAAERECERMTARFAGDWRGRLAVPVIRALRVRSDELRQHQLTRALGKLGHLGARDREVVTALASSLTNAFLHEPTVALLASPERADAARELFRLEDSSS